MTKNELLQKFVADLLREKGAGGSGQPTPSAKSPDAILQDLSDRLDHALLSALPDASLDQLLSSIDGDSDADFEQILATSGVDQAAVIQQVLNDYRTEFLKGDSDVK